MKTLLSLAIIFSLRCSNPLHAQVSLDEVLKTSSRYEQRNLLIQYIKTNEKDGIAHLWLADILNRFAYFNRNISKEFLEKPGNYFTTADSALTEYNKASLYLKASDVKKNARYFDQYRRRDVRTAEFVIKYEDILQDIDSKKGKLSALLLEACRDNGIAQPTAKPDSPSSEDKLAIKPAGKYYALIIGISDYNNYKLNLNRPTIDAEKLMNLLLANYSFEKENINLLRNPTRQEILSSLFSLRKKLAKTDNLLIFYAGHGMYDEDAGQGYWWPRDADSESPSNWLSNSDLRDQVRGIKAGHILLIADACFSGGIFRTRGPESIANASIDIVSLYKLPSRRAITSGTMTSVPDNSIFFDYLFKSLDNNTRAYLSSQVLFDSFRPHVINNTLQVPQDGIIAETGDEGGDFIFIKRN